MFRSRYFCDRVMIVIFCSLWYRMVSSLSEVVLLYMVTVLYYPYQTDVIPVVVPTAGAGSLCSDPCYMNSRDTIYVAAEFPACMSRAQRDHSDEPDSLQPCCAAVVPADVGPRATRSKTSCAQPSHSPSLSRSLGHWRWSLLVLVARCFDSTRYLVARTKSDRATWEA